MTLNDQVYSKDVMKAVGSGSDTPHHPPCQKSALFTVRLQLGRGGPAPSVPLPSSSWTKPCVEGDGVTQEPLCGPRAVSFALLKTGAGQQRWTPAQGLSSGEFTFSRAGRIPGLPASPASSPLVSLGTHTHTHTCVWRRVLSTQIWSFAGLASPCSRRWVASSLVPPLGRLRCWCGERGARLNSPARAGGGVRFACSAKKAVCFLEAAVGSAGLKGAGEMGGPLRL